MLTTTLNDIRKHSPCCDGWEKLLKHLGKTKADSEPVSFLTILDSNGIDAALWCLQTLPDDMDNAVRLLACDLVEPALKFTDDPRPREAVETARRFARGEATEGELKAARGSAWSAAPGSAQAAAWAAAWSAAGAVARDSVWAAAEDAAEDVARADQEVIFRQWLTQF